MGRLLVIATSYFALVIVSIWAFFIGINQYSTLDISTRLSILFAPANYAYIIFIVIYLFIAKWILNYWMTRKTLERISVIQSVLFVSSIVFHIISIFTWHYMQFTLSIMTMMAAVVSLAVLYFTYPLHSLPSTNRTAISLYFGWMTFLLMTNINFVLEFQGWDGFGLSNPLWAVIMLTIGTAIALHIRYHHFDSEYPAVFIWAYIAIMIHNGLNELLVSTAALFLSGVMLVGILYLKKKPAYRQD